MQSNLFGLLRREFIVKSEILNKFVSALDFRYICSRWSHINAWVSA